MQNYRYRWKWQILQIFSCVPLGPMMFHPKHYTQRLQASSISVDLLCSFPLNFPYGGFWAVALFSCCDVQQATYTLLLYPRNQVHLWLICIAFKVVFCFG